MISKLDNPKKPKNDVRVYVYRITKTGTRFVKFNLRHLKSLRISVKIGKKKYTFYPSLFEDKIERTEQGKQLFIQMIKQQAIRQYESSKQKQEEVFTDFLRQKGKYKEVKKGKMVVKEKEEIKQGFIDTTPIIVGKNKKINYTAELGQRIVSDRIKKSITYEWNSDNGFAQSEFLMGIDVDKYYTDKRYKNVSVNFKIFFKDEYGTDQKMEIHNLNIKKQLSKDIDNNMEKFRKGFKISLTNYLYYGLRAKLAEQGWTMTPKKYRVYTALNEKGEKVKRQRKALSRFKLIDDFSFILEVNYTE